MTTRTETAERVTDTAAFGWVAMAILGLGVFAWITILLLGSWTPPFDAPILAAARSWPVDPLVWRIISESANYPLIVIGIGMLIGLFVTNHRREAVLVAILLIAVTAGSEGVKQLVARPRPEGTDPNIPGVVYSYPSGHVLEVLTILGILAIRLVRSRASRLLAGVVVVAVILEAILVGVSRIALDAHYPSDALASLFGAAGVLGVYGLLTRGSDPSSARSRP
jgi:undecaprenyl-diphosphatase